MTGGKAKDIPDTAGGGPGRNVENAPGTPVTPGGPGGRAPITGPIDPPGGRADAAGGQLPRASRDEPGRGSADERPAGTPEPPLTRGGTPPASSTSERGARTPVDPLAQRYTLSPEANERIFQQKIVPDLARATGQKEPRLVIVGGQTGAGKTATTDMLLDTLSRRGNPTHINMDFYNPHHPYATQLRVSDPARADAYLRPDGDLWWAKAQDYAIQKRSDVLLESAMLNPSEFEGILSKFRDSGYRVEAALMAVPPPLSRLGILSRFNHEMRTTGSGRLVDTSIHDRCCEGVLRGAEAIDNGAADAVSIFRRNNIAVYSAQKPTGAAWPEPVQSSEAVTRELARPWTDQESLQFSRSFNQLAEQLGPEWYQPLSEIAELARPLLRPGTSLTVPQPPSWGLLRQPGR